MSIPQISSLPKSPLRNVPSNPKDNNIRFFEKKFTKLPQNRPTSARHDEIFLTNSPKPRKKGVSVKRANISKTRYHFKREDDTTFISRLRPRVIPIDKERLFDENIELKMKVNSFNDYIVRQKTKITYLEKEVLKRDDFIDELRKQPMDNYSSPDIKQYHMVESLKIVNKELKFELQKKDHEIGILKRNAKSTKYEELEIENHAYIDECTRLRRHLEEVMSDKSSPPGHIEIDGVNFIENKINENLKHENFEISKMLNKSKEEIKRLNENIGVLEKECLSEKKNNSKSMKTEIQKLKLKAEAVKREKVDLEEEMNKKMKKISIDHSEKIEETNKVIKKHELTISSMKNEITQLKSELNTTKTEALKKIPQEKIVIAKVPVFFLKMYNKIHKNKTKIKELLSKLKSSNGKFDDVTILVNELKSISIKTTLKEVLKALDKIGGKITIDEIIEKYEKFFEESTSSEPSSDSESEDETKNEPQIKISLQLPPTSSHPIEESKTSLPQSPQKPLIKISEVLNPLKHISLRMQLHRLTKAALSQVLFGESYNGDQFISKVQLLSLFENPPFGFRLSSELDKLCQFLLESENLLEKNSIKGIIEKLSCSLEDWKIFDQEDERNFDKLLTDIIHDNKMALLAACADKDTTSSEKISFSQFILALNECNVTLEEPLLKYISLLFYSHNFELECAPYMSFIKAYSDQEPETDYDEAGILEEEQADIVRQYLSKIAENLMKLQKSASEVFISSEAGLISHEKFINGLHTLELSGIDKDHMNLLIEALQYDEEPNTSCIHIKELEEILHHYHVTLGVFDAASDRSSSSAGHIKKVSMLETETLEHEENPVEKITYLKLADIPPFTGNFNSSRKKSFADSSRFLISETGTIKQSDLELSDFEARQDEGWTSRREIELNQENKVDEEIEHSFSEESSAEKVEEEYEEDSFNESIQSEEIINEETKEDIIIYKSMPLEIAKTQNTETSEIHGEGAKDKAEYFEEIIGKDPEFIMPTVIQSTEKDDLIADIEDAKASTDSNVLSSNRNQISEVYSHAKSASLSDSSVSNDVENPIYVDEKPENHTIQSSKQSSGSLVNSVPTERMVYDSYSHSKDEIAENEKNIGFEEHKKYSLHSFEPDIEPTRSDKSLESAENSVRYKDISENKDIAETIESILNQNSPSIFDANISDQKS